MFGERLALDLDNAMYAVAEGLVNAFKEQNDHEGFRLAGIVNFGIDTNITAEELSRSNENQLAEKLYTEAITNYERRKQDLMVQAVPVFKNIRLQQGSQIDNVIVPFTDGRKQMQVLANMEKTLKTNGAELLNSLERSITLGLIDDAWKEHLRSMDDLKQSVQTATYEQKDPLVIYKMEAFELFKKMDGEVNREIVQFLCHASIPLSEGDELKEGRQEKTDLSRLSANKEQIDAAGNDLGANENDYYDPSPAKQEPVKVGPKIGRNDPCPCGSGKKFKSCHGKDA
ncbi:MAG: preprotein translocase subunit SecA [Chitinophagaceae bacterium]|nr:MAG: preprotein translocase subunit SecA [Chitinophagaceae bacterium]